jgi:FkbM family methyltransferase
MTRFALPPDVVLPPLVRTLVRAPYAAKVWAARRPIAWRYYTGACRRLGWNAECLGWHTPSNGPFAGIRIQALHTNHVWAPAGIYEPAVAGVLLGLLREYSSRGEMWDIGANRGLIALLAARHFAGRVVAVELLPANITRLQQQLAANPSLASRIDVVTAAASDADGEVEMLVDLADGAVCQIVAAGVQSYEHTPQTVIQKSAARAVDSLVAERHCRVAVMKIDVEGAEALVLRGARRLLREQTPALVVEIHNAAAGAACDAVLADARYSIHRLLPDGSLEQVKNCGGYGHIVARPTR